jgi:hypothetical protein
MASHFSSIGFPIADEADFERTGNQAIEAGQGFPVPGLGTYVLWEVGEGIELWVHIDPENYICGFNPHFSGVTRIRVGVLGEKTEGLAGPLDGCLRGWASPPEGQPDLGEYPFVFDIPDRHLRSLEFPSIQTFGITGFAHSLEVFTDENDYGRKMREGKAEDEPIWAHESFLPLGLFSPGDEDAGGDDEVNKDGEVERNEAHPVAFFTGTVLAAREIVNPFTNIPFQWASVRTYGGEYDIVADRELLARPLEPGNIVQGEFWLTGRLAEEREN